MVEEILVSSANPESEEVELEDQVAPPLTSESPPAQGPELREVSDPEQRPKRRRRQHRMDLSKVQAGQQYNGRVVGLAKFGAFVDIGVGRDGLVHISELGKGFVDKVDGVLSIGDEITVWVKGIDQERKRISLTMVEAQSQRLSLRELEPGMVLNGTVEGIANFGAFVDIGALVNGLVHISEMAEGYVRRPQSIVSPGDDVQVRVLEVDPQDRKISLSMKGLETRDAVASQNDTEPTMTAMQFAWEQALASKDRE